MVWLPLFYRRKWRLESLYFKTDSNNWILPSPAPVLRDPAYLGCLCLLSARHLSGTSPWSLQSKCHLSQEDILYLPACSGLLLLTVALLSRQFSIKVMHSPGWGTFNCFCKYWSSMALLPAATSCADGLPCPLSFQPPNSLSCVCYVM